MPGLVIIQADAVRRSQQLIDGTSFLDERPTGSAVRVVAAHDQERTRRNERHHLMILHGRDMWFYSLGQIPWVGPVAHAQADTAFVEDAGLEARLKGHGVEDFLGAKRMADATDARSIYLCQRFQVIDAARGVKGHLAQAGPAGSAP